MWKKILSYGAAFGSIEGAFLFVNLNNYNLETSDTQRALFLLLISIVIPGICIFFLSKNLRKDLIEGKLKGSRPGVIIIGGMFTTIVFSLVVTGIYSLIYKSFPDIINQVVQTDLTKFEADKEQYIEVYKKTESEIREMLTERYSVGNQLRANFMQFTSIGLLISCIMALLYMNKDRKAGIK